MLAVSRGPCNLLHLPHLLHNTKAAAAASQPPPHFLPSHAGTITAREAEDMCDFLNDGGTATDAYVNYGTKTKQYHMRVTALDCFALTQTR